MESWKVKYIEMLEDINVTFGDTAKFVKQYMPNKLFAYRKFDTFWRQNLLEGQVHLSVASNFNDPFDSAAKIELKNHKSDMGKAYTEFCKNPKYTAAKNEIDKEIKKFVSDFQNGIKLSCFTEKADSILMWSYYAQYHQGFCVEYDTSKHCVFDGIVFPVVYSEERYNAVEGLISQSENLAINPVLYKAKEWEHEKEWRIFLDVHNTVHKSDEFILKDAISAVYLGAKFEENYNYTDILEEIKTWAKINKISVKKIKLNDKHYKLEYETIL